MVVERIQFPMIAVRVPPHIKKDALQEVERDQVITVRERYDVFVGGETRTSGQSMVIARTIALHEGFLPPGYEVPVMGAQTTQNIEKYKNIMRQIMTELYGQSSFLYEYVRGEVSAENCRVAITKWHINATQCELAVEGETAAQRESRLSDAVQYRRAIARLQNDVKEAYGEAVREATILMSARNTKATDKFEMAQRLSFWRTKENEDVQPMVTVFPLVATAGELESLKPLPLAYRDDSIQQRFWDSKVNKDLLPTMFRRLTGQVDLINLVTDHERAVTWAGRLSATMHIIQQHVVMFNDIQAQISQRSTDPTLRAVINIKPDQARANAHIKSLRDLVAPENRGDWRDIPILPSGRKRAAPRNRTSAARRSSE